MSAPVLPLASLLLAALLGTALLMRRGLGRGRLYQVIFESDTPAGRSFDLALLAAIVLSVLVVGLETDAALERQYGGLFRVLEVLFSVLFSFEYLLRLLCSPQPLRYARSFLGIVDFLSSIPTLAALGATGGQALAVIRIVRLLRVFRILKLGSYLQEAQLLQEALIASRRKILVFLLTIVTLVVIIGALMYVIEGPARGFSSIPVGVYWAVVTITTVGYGDVAPVTPLGRITASVVMLLGYSIIAVPTGIISAELGNASRSAARGGATDPPCPPCPGCGEQQHRHGARFCHQCGQPLQSQG
jgi:voltage-gated potassium channel